MTAFILGNGKSRLGLDLQSLKSAGKVFGCNALFRDFSPDVLVSTDPGITKEIEESGYPSTNEFFTRKPGHANSKVIPKNNGYSSGPVATTIAALEGFDKIYLLGFDLIGIQGKHNNVYSGTPNYKEVNSNETYYGNWISQILNISKDFKHQTFIRVGSVSQHLPDKWSNRDNIKHRTIDEFLLEVNTVSWQKPNE